MAETALLIAVLVSTTVGVVSAISQGQAAKDASEYNASLLRKRAEYARLKGDEEARKHRIETRRQLGSMRASFGASGLTLGDSALDVLQDSAATGALDALTIKHNAEIQALGYESDATLSLAQGDAASTAGYLGAAGELAGGVAKGLSFGLGGSTSSSGKGDSAGNKAPAN